MKAILHTKYGAPDVLELKEVEKPTPSDNEVLIKIHATTVSTGDCNARNFTFVPKVFWLPGQMYFGIFRPRINILGTELAGEIEEEGVRSKFPWGLCPSGVSLRFTVTPTAARGYAARE